MSPMDADAVAVEGDGIISLSPPLLSLSGSSDLEIDELTDLEDDLNDFDDFSEAECAWKVNPTGFVNLLQP